MIYLITTKKIFFLYKPVKLKIRKRIRRWYGISQIKKNGFWFVDIPRTSSTSIKVQLAQQYGRTYAKSDSKNGLFRDHLMAKKMMEILGKEEWEKIFTFSVVRNPWDRAVSFYNYLLKYNMSKKTFPSFKEHVRIIKTNYNEDKFTKRRLLHGCHEFISDNNRIIVDKIVRFENREEELKEIGNEIGINNLGSTHEYKILGQKSYNEFYDNETRKIIEEVYAKDIEEFGYSFE